MIILYIFLGFLLFLGLLLLCDISVDFAFMDKFSLKVKFLKFTLYSTKDKKQKNKAPRNTEKTVKEKKSFFEVLKEKYGFSGAIREIFQFAKDCLVHIKKFLRHILIEKVFLEINIATEDAAQTAIEYGTVCSAAYPTLALFQSIAKVKYKEININSDFEGKTPNVKFSASIKAKIIFIIILGFGIFSEYKKFNARMVQDERE